ncbi:6341_t:CDS:2, partial [Dentiscutata heterogama]
HNYLDKKYHVQLTLGHLSTKPRRPPVHLYGNSQISSLKLIMSSKPDTGIIPHNIILPLGDDREVFSFQTDTLNKLSLEFDIFPTFGSKVIGKGVALPHVFNFTNGRERRNNLVTEGTGGKCICPVFDTHLKVVGELSFEFAIVKPFQGVQLEIGGQVETYWKSTNTVSLPGSVGDQSPSTGGTNSRNISSFITSSSLSGEYIQIVVQVTRDMVAVVYSEWMLPVEGFDLSVSDVTVKQFKSLSQNCPPSISYFRGSFKVNLEIKYPTVFEMSRYWFSDIPDINTYVDTILQTVYDHAQGNTTNNGDGKPPSNRSVMFSSFNPAICTTLNWKQPNYAVFFNSYCGFDNKTINYGKKRKEQGDDATHGEEIEQDKRCTSIKEAVKFAKINNLLGVIFEATLLVHVPSLITNVKQAGLILTTFGSANNDPRNIRIQERYGVDAMVID